MSNKTILVSTILLIFYFLVAFAITRFIKDPRVLLEQATQVYILYGYLIIFIVALLEGIFIISFFIPGTVVVMFGATLAAKGEMHISLVVLAAASGFILGSVISYWIGRVGWYHIVNKFHTVKDLMHKHVERYPDARRIIFLSYMSTGIGVMLATAAGILRIPFRQFLGIVLPAQIFWTILWASFAFLFGKVFASIFVSYALFVVFFSVGLYLLKKRVLK